MKVFVEAEENISVDTENLLCLSDIGHKLADVSRNFWPSKNFSQSWLIFIEYKIFNIKSYYRFTLRGDFFPVNELYVRAFMPPINYMADNHINIYNMIH